MSRAPEAEEDPVQVLGEKYRVGVLDVVLSILDSPEFKAADLEERIQAEFAGLMLGFCGALLSMSKPEGHAEIRSLLIEYLPTYFDDAREGMGLPRLGASRGDIGDDAFYLQHRLQAAIGGVNANTAAHELANVAAILFLTTCATKEDAKRCATMMGDVVRRHVLNRWSDPDFVASREKLQRAARGRMN